MSDQKLNHCLAQLYTADDFIQEHSDKTLDIAEGTGVINVSFGATRDFVIRPKKAHAEFDELERIRRGVISTSTDGKNTPIANENCSSSSENDSGEILYTLTDGSIYKLGCDTNMRMTHQIRKLADENDAKRYSVTDLRKEFSHFDNGCRISLTFRHIATYEEVRLGEFDSEKSHGEIVGRGARTKIVESNQNSITNSASFDQEQRMRDARELLDAFADENVTVDFIWDEVYGRGFSCSNRELQTAFKEKLSHST